MQIAVGQKWRTHAGTEVEIKSYDESHWLGQDIKTGHTYKYNENGCCYPEGFSGFDLQDCLTAPAENDADSLASETLQALGWSFDGQCWVQPAENDVVLQHPLYKVMVDAIVQAMYGKGKRHGGNATPFLDQPWVHYMKMHGRGFATGQAAKKLEEAASTRSGDAFENEMLGAIVYCGMAILKERGVV